MNTGALEVVLEATNPILSFGAGAQGGEAGGTHVVWGDIPVCYRYHRSHYHYSGPSSSSSVTSGIAFILENFHFPPPSGVSSTVTKY